MGTHHPPHSGRSCELALRALGASRGCIGGACLACVTGVQGRALSYPRPPVLWGVLPAPTTHWLWVRGVWAWGPVTNPAAHALASWLCALWGRREGARGGRLLPVCGASTVGRSSTPDRPSSGTCGWGPLPTGCGCGGSGCGDPSPTRQRALLRAGFARCGGGTRAPGGGASCLGLGRPGSGALPLPTARPFGRAAGAHHPLAVGAGAVGTGTRHQPHSARSGALALRALWAAPGRPGGPSLPVCGASGVGRSPSPDGSSFGACCRGPLPTGFGYGGCGRGDPSPTPQCKFLRSGSARCWGGTKLPREAASCLGVGRPGSGALPPRTTRPLGRAAWPHYPLAVGAGVVGVGTRHKPHSARFCELALRAVGAAGGRPEGAPLACVWGVQGRVLSHPRPLVLWSVLPGPTTHWLWVRGVRVWGPVTNPTAHALASWVCAVGAARGHPGGAPLACVWDVRGRAPSHPRPLVLWGIRPGPTTHWLWVRGVRAWRPVTNPTAPALASWPCTLWGRHKGAQGGRLLSVCGASGVGRSPTPDRPPFGAYGRGPLPSGIPCGVQAFGPGCPWHLPPCLASTCVVRASRVCGTRCPLCLDNCHRAVVVAGGVPLCRASWPRVGAPRLVRSGRPPCSGWLSRRRGAFLQPGGCRPRLYWVAALGTWRPAENRGHCACSLPLPRHRLWARSASYPFGAPRWG